MSGKLYSMPNRGMKAKSCVTLPSAPRMGNAPAAPAGMTSAVALLG